MHPLVGNCRTCDYSLIRLTEPRCPECGTPFDPNDPGTMTIHRSRLIDFLSKPMPLWLFAPPILLFTAAWALHMALNRPSVVTVSLLAAGCFSGTITLYIWAVKTKFRRWLKKREKAKGVA